jgi:hypothetical protein
VRHAPILAQGAAPARYRPRYLGLVNLLAFAAI